MALTFGRRRAEPEDISFGDAHYMSAEELGKYWDDESIMVGKLLKELAKQATQK